MSFPISRGRGRGSSSRGSRTNTPSRSASAGPSNVKSTASSGLARGAPRTFRGASGTSWRGNGAQMPRGGRGGSAPRASTFNKPAPRRAADGGVMSGGPLKDRYEQLKKVRELERKDAEQKGIVSAPGQARQLSDAVTPVGTCLDMCPEWERVERAFQNSVAPEELDPDKSAYAPGAPLPIEARMVKKFKRPGAGDGDQLPSDLRPPPVLKATCDYLFRDLLGNAPSIASVHGFIWDRTRAIRNDFSIQQVTKLEDVRIAIECFERIARFHILALHQMATPEIRQQVQNGETTYDPQQEREQLDRTLLSLMQYYDDYRGRLQLTNEAEFRSYCVMFQLDSSQTDTEDRVQTWPKTLLADRNVQAAMQLFAAACTAFRRLGPFKALAAEHVIARQDWEWFWKLIDSPKISYLQACVAEIYFHLVRDIVLRSIVRAMRPSKAVNGKLTPSTDWSMNDLRELFNFDHDEELESFCKLYDLDFHQVGDEDYLDVSPVAGRTLQTPTFAKSIQRSSWIVEQKRYGRSFAAVIDGMTVRQAQEAGMIEEAEGNDEMADVTGDQEAAASGDDDSDSLFIPEVRENGSTPAQTPFNAMTPGSMSASPFGQPAPASTTPFGQPKSSTFGQPSGGTFSAFGKPTTSNPSAPAFDFKPAETVEKKSPFSFLSPSAPKETPAAQPAATGSSMFPSMTSASLFKPQGTSSDTVSVGEASDKSAAPSAPLFPAPASAEAPKTASIFNNPFQSTTTENPFKSAATNDLFKPAATKDLFKTPATNNPFSAPATAPASSQANPATPTFTFSKPEQAQNAPTLFSGLSAPAPAPAAAAPSTVSETNSKSTPAPSFTSTQPQPATSLSTSAPTSQDASGSSHNAGSQSPPRRSSINNLPDTKPKKPSPLSHSFTASDNSSSPADASKISRVSANQPSQDLFPGRQRTGLPQSFTQTKPVPQPTVNQQAAPDFDAVLSRLAEELTTDPVSGFLKQYVDYTVKQVITKVQESLYWERMNSEADEYRSWFLQDKFGKRWRDICRRQRLAKHAKERRNRAQKRLRESLKSDSHDIGEALDAASSLRRSKANSVASLQSKREKVDTMYKSIIGDIRFSGDRQAQAGSKRSVSSQEPEPAVPAGHGHKRMKSTSHIDDRGRVVKPLSASNANADVLKRSSFLNFSLANDAPNRGSTTNSTYFRMKALGVKQAADAGLGLSRGIKRPRSESLGTDRATPPSRLSSSLFGSSPDQPREKSDGRMGPPSTRSVRSRTDDDDEALFARLKAAREVLGESGSFMRDEVERDAELRRSAGSLVDKESPSLARARAEIRFQASQADSAFGASLSGRDVPAYRLRESRFVPREQYPRAIERANEMLASRSEHANRSQSRAGNFSLDSPTEHKANNGAPLNANNPPLSQPSFGAPSANGSNGISTESGLISNASSNTAPAVQSSSGFAAANFPGTNGSTFSSNSGSFSQLAAPAQVTNAPDPFLEDSFTQESQNPFLQVPATNGLFGSQMPTDAASTPAAQPSYNFGFGAPQINAESMNMQQPSFVSGFGVGAMYDTFDSTIQPSQIDDALAQTFGQPDQDGRTPSASPPPQASHLFRAASKPMSMSSDKGTDEEIDNHSEHLDNGMEVGEDESHNSQPHKSGRVKSNAYTNRFALLEGNEEDDESQESASDDQADEELASDEEQTEPQPDSYQYDDGATEEYDSDVGEEFQGEHVADQVRGHASIDQGDEFYSEDDGEEAGDEMVYDSEDFDSEEGSYDEDEEDGRPFVPQAAFGHPQPQPNAALQVVGNNVEEAIELSD